MTDFQNFRDPHFHQLFALYRITHPAALALQLAMEMAFGELPF